MTGICVIAPHADDEILGAGGTLLKAVSQQVPVYWLLLTSMEVGEDASTARVEARREEVQSIQRKVPFKDAAHLGFQPAELDQVSRKTLVSMIKNALDSWRPSMVIIPWQHDAHTDHGVVFDAALSATKAFRAPYVHSVLAMEILSETNFARAPGFVPTWYVDISEFIEKKVELMKAYRTEIQDHPFSRSEQSIRALATLRGSEMGTIAAEAFHVMRHHQ